MPVESTISSCGERSRFVHRYASTLAFEPFREVLQHVDGTLTPTVEVHAIAVTHMRGFDLEDRGKALIVSWHIGGADNPIVPPPTRPSRGTIKQFPIAKGISGAMGDCEAEVLRSNECGGGQSRFDEGDPDIRHCIVL
jgi:hypothetical protein